MRVLHLIDTEAFAGTERHVLQLSRSLVRIGVDSVIACRFGTPIHVEAQRLGVRFETFLKYGGKSRLLASGSLFRRVAGSNFDIVHAHNGRTAMIAGMAQKRINRRQLVYTQHFMQPAHTDRRGVARLLYRRAHNWVNHQIDYTIAISTAVRDKMLARGDCPANRVMTVLNGIADPRAQLLRPTSEVRRELGLASDVLLVVCAARLEAEKGLGTLVEAMGRVACVNPVICTIAGTGSQRDELQRAIDSAGLTTRMRLLGFCDDMLSLIDAADVFVLPSPAEPFGLSIVEAMALGKPVIACAAGGPLEIVQHGMTGLLVPPSNPAAMSAAIERLLKSKELRRRFGENGRARYLDYFTAARMAKEISRVYRRALAPAASAAGLTATSTGSV